MSTLAIVLFIAGALLVAAVLIVSSIRTGRIEEREIAEANARADLARREAQAARALRVKLADADRQLAAAAADPRGPGDGLGRELAPTGRFKRRAEAPAPSRPAGRHVRT